MEEIQRDQLVKLSLPFGAEFKNTTRILNWEIFVCIKLCYWRYNESMPEIIHWCPHNRYEKFHFLPDHRNNLSRCHDVKGKTIGFAIVNLWLGTQYNPDSKTLKWSLRRFVAGFYFEQNMKAMFIHVGKNSQYLIWAWIAFRAVELDN